MVLCRYLGRSCVEIVTDSDHIIIDPNYVENPRKGINVILLTHEHDDHLSEEKINRINGEFRSKDQELKIFGPISTIDKVSVEEHIIIEDESVIELDNGKIEVFSIDCWKSEACVAYLIDVDDKRILHTADSANYSKRLRTIEKAIDCCFIATFEDFYEDYLNFIKTIEPKLTIPYHFSPDKKEMGKNLATYLEKNDIEVIYLNPGEEISL
jgi:L-ascorbate metabolism protein UlaG (beta-lactamase superfamily)